MNSLRIETITAAILGIMMIIGLCLALFPTASLAQINVQIGATSTTETRASTGTKSTSTSNTDASLEGDMIDSVDVMVNTEIEIGRDEAEGDSSSARVEANSVDTSAELQAYARSAVRSDENVDSIVFNSDEVEIRYKEKGYLFAIIPINMTVEATALASGEVEVEYPWYAFLTLDNKDEVESQVKVAVSSLVSARATEAIMIEGEADGTAGFSARESAMIAAAMQTALRSTVEAK